MPADVGGYHDPLRRAVALNSVNHQAKTLINELGHHLLRHVVELDGLSLAYTEHELIVESVAFTVCGSVGLDSSAFSVPYLMVGSIRLQA